MVAKRSETNSLRCTLYRLTLDYIRLHFIGFFELFLFFVTLSVTLFFSQASPITAKAMDIVRARRGGDIYIHTIKKETRKTVGLLISTEKYHGMKEWKEGEYYNVVRVKGTRK